MIADIIAGFLSGIIGAMGFGGGGILILYLTIYRHIPQLNAQGINLLFFIPSAISALIMHSKNHLIEWKVAFKYILLGLVGVSLGFIAIKYINGRIIAKIFAVILIITGIRQLFSDKKN